MCASGSRFDRAHSTCAQPKGQNSLLATKGPSASTTTLPWHTHRCVVLFFSEFAFTAVCPVLRRAWPFLHVRKVSADSVHEPFAQGAPDGAGRRACNHILDATEQGARHRASSCLVMRTLMDLRCFVVGVRSGGISSSARVSIRRAMLIWSVRVIVLRVLWTTSTRPSRRSVARAENSMALLEQRAGAA